MNNIHPDSNEMQEAYIAIAKATSQATCSLEEKLASLQASSNFFLAQIAVQLAKFNEREEAKVINVTDFNFNGLGEFKVEVNE